MEKANEGLLPGRYPCIEGFHALEKNDSWRLHDSSYSTSHKGNGARYLTDQKVWHD